jgi:hypothetical protein
MKLYRLNECDWWAADSMEEAIALAMKETELPRDELVDETFLCEEDPAKVMVTDEDSAPRAPFKLREIAEELKKYGDVFERQTSALEEVATELYSISRKPAAQVMATMTKPGLVCSSEW